MAVANPYPAISAPTDDSQEIRANTGAPGARGMSIFRASPWVSYEPTQPESARKMNQDVDMDAPQISTLREEETPPPQPKTAGSRKAKSASKGRMVEQPEQPIWVPSTRKGETIQLPQLPIWARSTRKAPQTEEEEFDEAEDEEDQLIYDDDEDMMKPIPPGALHGFGRSADGLLKRKAAAAKRKTKKRPPERKPRDKTTTSSTPLSWVEAGPSEPHDELVDDVESGHPTPDRDDTSPSKPLSPKKLPRKNQALPRIKLKPQSKLRVASALPMLADDGGGLSEGYTGTAASSPATMLLELNTPEPENPLPATAPVIEETNYENVPHPIYPLPTKPFPVQPPPKIGTGFAPVIPIDRSGKKVRHWRIAQREIRGIGGGRWFARTWVGEKESEFAAAAQVKGEDKHGGVTLPKLSGVSVSAPPLGKGRSKGKTVSSLTASAAPSRAGSSIPDVPSSTVRAPTKMRTIIGPPSEAGDSDMGPPPEP